MQTSITDITLFLLITTIIVLLLATFIITIIFAYQKKQMSYYNTIDHLKSDFEKNLFKTQVEVQEQTFQSVSREIHDNISLSLTLAKLHLATFESKVSAEERQTIKEMKELLSTAIDNLRNISRSMNPQTISEQGVIYALEKEIERIRTFSKLRISFTVTGNVVFTDSDKELIMFRITQEAFNNILKHSSAPSASLNLHYGDEHVDVLIADQGRGFCKDGSLAEMNGLLNMEKRIKACNGTMDIESVPGSGTTIKFSIPY